MGNKIWINWENKKVLTNRGERFDEINRIYSQIVKDDNQLAIYLYNKYNTMVDMFTSLLNKENNINDVYKDFDNWCYIQACNRVQDTFEEIELK